MLRCVMRLRRLRVALFIAALFGCGGSDSHDATDPTPIAGTGAGMMATAGTPATGGASGGAGTGVVTGTGGAPGTGGASGAGGAGGAGMGGAGAGGMGGGADEVRFAVIGDYGDDLLSSLGLGGEGKVAELVKSWDPDFVITTGDNNYPNGAANTIDANIGKHYAEFIGDYQGMHGPGSDVNRFWPSLGNHDWKTPNAQPYLDYFTLPGNERYYDKDLGLVHLFVVDSDPAEPDGVDATSTQGMWLQGALGASTSCLDVVYFHHPPYSSGSDHGSTMNMQWPFEEWGADVVMAGHDHLYERLAVGGLPYFVNGLGGSLRYPFGPPLPESQMRFAEDYGAMLVTVTRSETRYDMFRVAGGEMVDTLTVAKACP